MATLSNHNSAPKVSLSPSLFISKKAIEAKYHYLYEDFAINHNSEVSVVPACPQDYKL